MKILNTFYNIKVCILLCLAILFYTCRQENSIPEVKPLLKTNPVGLNHPEIAFSGEFILSGSYRSIHYGFQLDKDAAFSDPIILEAGSDPQPGKFNMTAPTALRPSTSYWVRTWASSEKYQVYGNVVEFKTPAERKGEPVPSITKVYPQTALWGDTIKIAGKYFDYFGMDNKVVINGTEAKIWMQKDTLVAIVPEVLEDQNKFKILVKVGSKTAAKEYTLELTPPSISGLNKNEGQYPDTITLAGDYFSSYRTSVRVDGIETEIVNLSKKSISFIVPFLKDEKTVNIELKRSYSSFPLSNDFHYHSQAILQLSKTSAWLGDTLKLYGRNLDFRKIKLDIKNPDPKLLNIGSSSATIANRWKDSVAFILKGSPEASNFKLDIQFGKLIAEFPYVQYTTMDQKTVLHSAPLLETLNQKEYTYYEMINWHSKGMYFNLSPQGHIIKSLSSSFSVDSYETNTHPWSSGLLQPGEYSLQLYSSGRFSNTEYFTVKEPVIESISPTTFDRSTAQIITGQNLPVYTTLTYTHLQSGREFSIKAKDLGTSSTQRVIPLQVIGKGTYQVSINIGGKSYRSPVTLEANDYLSFLMKTTEPVRNTTSLEGSFAIQNKIYLLQRNEMNSIDLNTGKITRKAGYYIYGQPRFIEGKIYINNNNSYYEFNETTEEWTLLSNDGIEYPNRIEALVSLNHKLCGIATDGGIYLYDQKWVYLTKIIKNITAINYSVSKNGYLYLFSFYDGKISVYSTTTWTLDHQIQMPDRYDTYYLNVFELNDEIYYSAIPGGLSGYTLLYKYSFLSNSFYGLSPKNLGYNYLSGFCPDGSGNVYFYSEDYIYKFNP